MVGRIHNKARKERERLREQGDVLAEVKNRSAAERARAAELEKLIDTPGSGFTRFECLCGHSVVMSGFMRGDTFRCAQCGEARQTVI